MPVATTPRLSSASRLCGACGWFLPALPAEQVCARCGRDDAKPRRMGAAPRSETVVPPMTAAERLFLAAMLLRDDPGAPAVGAADADATRWFLTLAARLLTARLSPGAVVPGSPAGQRVEPIRSVDELPPIPDDVFQADKLPLGTPLDVIRARLAHLAEAWRAKKCPL